MFVCTEGTSQDAPSFTVTNIPYSASVDPSDQFSERVGAYWSFRRVSNSSGDDGGNIFPAFKPTNPKSAPRNQPPAAIPFDQELVIPVSGVAASSDVTQGRDPTDEAVRLTGADNSCLKIEGLSTEDTCLSNPSSCHLKANGTRGFSMSIWLNVPNSFDTNRKYIFDTGATEKGNPGVTISYTSSDTSFDFNMEVTVLVSTGSQYWQAVLGGMIKPYAWTNLGIRWSPDVEPTTGLVYGLQVFINKMPTVWTRSPSPALLSDVTASPIDPLAPSRWTVGCDLGGQNAMLGRLDELAIWYWRIRDAAVNTKNLPASASEYGELELLDGNLQLSKATGPCMDVACLPGSSVIDLPESFVKRHFKTTIALEHPEDRDISPAVEGDCRRVDPSTWKGNSMIYCVDTVKELKEAVFTTVIDFKALPFLQAVVRIVDKAPSGLSQQDVDDLYAIVSTNGTTLLKSEIAENSLNLDDAWNYLDIVYVISKLSEVDKYSDVWHTKEFSNREAGITNWNRLCDQWLEIIGVGIIGNTAISKRYKAANHTAAAVFKLQSATASKQEMIFPGDLSGEEGFLKSRSITWGSVTDTLTFPLPRFSAYNKYTALVLVMKMHNLFDLSVPAFLDDRIQGLGRASFFVNSRVLSVSAHGNMSDHTALKNNPVSFTVQHRQEQDDKPYLKAPILCVRWKYAENSKSGIGAWDTDGCDLVKTDDRQTTCQCADDGDYAILMENYSPPDAISLSYYDAPLILYAVSIACLVIFIITIIVHKGLHYEMHFVHSNLAFAVMLALVFYVSTMKAKKDQIACMIVSAFVQYGYLSAYAWFALSAHYACRAVVSGQLGRILFQYTLLGWGLPGIIVTICVSTRVDLYGFGSRCLGSQSQNFLSIYVGTFLFLCALVLPMLVVSICNIRGKNWISRNPDDWSDVKASLLGLAIMWPLVSVVWVMIVCIYLIPQPYQAFDFLFEFFNSIQGILILFCLGFTIPSFRQAFFCRRKYEKDLLLAEEYRRRRNELHPYHN